MGHEWEYDIVISNRVRIQYNLLKNLTNDISTSIFATLREKAVSLQLKQYNPLGNFFTLRMLCKNLLLIHSTLIFVLFYCQIKVEVNSEKIISKL